MQCSLCYVDCGPLHQINHSGMPICDRCIAAVCQLLPKTQFDRKRPVTSTLPTYRNTKVRKCWICSRFSRWLQERNPEVFGRWRRRPLRVVYRALASGLVERGDKSLPIFLLVLLVSHVLPVQSKSRYGCDLELSILPENGTVRSFTTQYCTLPLGWQAWLTSNHE